MVNPDAMAKYRATIGIECHVQLKTKTKLFSAVSNDAAGAAPNTLVSHICFGLPGALPVLNEAAIELATRAAFALDSRPQHFSKFDRKHYFYPDLPMGYQITQFSEPIILGGKVDTRIEGKPLTIGITRAHLEADAGKSVHDKSHSLVDLNRAGTPLLEIVSEPDMRSSSEAKAYARELYLRMRYADVSDADLFHGNMRFDVNVSVSKSGKMGTRTETKNLNSFRSVEKAVDYEIERQIEQLEKGKAITQETRGWDDAKQRTFSQRSKEDAEDYRYMPDPDLPPVVLDKAYIDRIEAEMPIMPAEWRERLSQLKLDEAHIETLIEAETENQQISYLPLIELVQGQPKLAKFLANWFVNLEIPLRREGDITNVLKDVERTKIYQAVYQLYEAGQLSSTGVKALLSALLEQDVVPENIEEFASKSSFIQLSDESAIKEIVKNVIKTNPQAAADVKNGESKAIGFLVGQVMKHSKGQANPSLAQDLIKQQLNQ
jgi:aspartyl-tRNA(Asn)/glutamyl-tRNA(Gln) amidotransferase subunit B